MKKYTKGERLQIAAVLRKCLKYLNQGRPNAPATRETYICHALEEVHNHASNLPWGYYILLGDACNKATEVISSRIRPYSSVAGWLHGNEYIPSATNTAEVQKFRTRWVHELIREFSQ